jgi:NTP pyrophosphatase (non-canonical NTP hydrolase)
MLLQYDNEKENLEILAEECAEVQQIKSKIARFGLDDVNVLHPEGPTNRERLEQELGHIMAMVSILVAQGTISRDGIVAGEQHKLEKLYRWYGGRKG